MGICKRGGCACERREGMGTHSGGRENVRAGAHERECWALRTLWAIRGRSGRNARWRRKRPQVVRATGQDFGVIFKAEVTKFDSYTCCVSNIISEIFLSFHLRISPSNSRKHSLVFT